jgi:hypothetical protein
VNAPADVAPVEVSTSWPPAHLEVVRTPPGTGGSSDQHTQSRHHRPDARVCPVSRPMAEIGKLGQPVGVLAGGDVDPATGRLLSIAQLQAALRACEASVRTAAQAPTAAAIQIGLLGIGPDRSLRAGLGVRAPHHGWLLVVAAHPGAGCSTTALAIADAAATAGSPVHLVEAGQPGLLVGGGLAAVTHHELGVVAGGWRRGRRGLVTLDRAAGTGPRTWPPPAPHQAVDQTPVTVLDAGAAWAGTEDEVGGRAAPWWSAGASAPSAVVVVCRASIPGISGAERLLDRLKDLFEMDAQTDVAAGGGTTLLAAVVGGARLRGPLRAACGPYLGRLQAQRRVVGVPHVRYLELTGPTADALPRSLTAAGRGLWALARPGHFCSKEL